MFDLFGLGRGGIHESCVRESSFPGWYDHHMGTSVQKLAVLAMTWGPVVLLYSSYHPFKKVSLLWIHIRNGQNGIEKGGKSKEKKRKLCQKIET